MAASATLLQPAVATAARTTRKAGFSLKDFLDILAKALLMAQALPDTGRPTALQVQNVRKIAESI